MAESSSFAQQPNPSSSFNNPNGTGVGVPANIDYQKPIVQLAEHWIKDYCNSREKTLCALAEKLHSDYVNDHQSIRQRLMDQFKTELEETKAELIAKHERQFAEEIEKQKERWQRELDAAKKKQWCFQCESEAIYYCCWNTSYCSVDCQQSHWALHRRFCRRKNPNGGAPANRT